MSSWGIPCASSFRSFEPSALKCQASKPAVGLQFFMATLGCLLLLQFSALRDLDCLRGSVTTALGHVLNLFDNVVALEDLAKDDMTTIEPPTRVSMVELIQNLGNTHEVIAVVMKNWEPLVSLPALAMPTHISFGTSNHHSKKARAYSGVPSWCALS